MADKALTDLPDGGAAANGDVIYVVRDGNSRKATFPTLADVATTGDYGDLDNTPTLGGAAALDVGTSAGTVAAGDDSRITGAVQKAGDTGLGGFTSTGHNLGNLSGTVTPEPTATSNFKYGANVGAFTLEAPTTAGYYTIAILVTNAGSGAGAMTATGFSKVHGTFAADANKKQVLTIEVFGSDKILTIRDAS